MKSTNRLLQILAILGAVSSGYFYYKVETIGTASQAELEESKTSLQFERSKIATLTKKIAEQSAEIESHASNSDNSKAEIVSLNAKLGQLQRESQRLQDDREAQTATEEKLQQENARLAAELAQLQANSVSKSTVTGLQDKITKLERDLLESQQTTASNTDQTGSLRANTPANPKITGSVLTVPAGAPLVIIDVGFSGGVRLNDEFVIQHADTPIAKIQVYDVKENLSIARVLPESVIKTPQKGDKVSSLN